MGGDSTDDDKTARERNRNDQQQPQGAVVAANGRTGHLKVVLDVFLDSDERIYRDLLARVPR